MKETREFLFYCGMFHDAGKLYFLDTINLFARTLFNEEFDLIRLHPQMGYELLSKWDSTRPYAEAALYHHLWYDEKGGYPREYTYKGNDNAILYQILTCADCLDAATDSVGRLITVEREQLYREVFGKKRGAGSITLVSVYGVNSYIRIL